MDRDRAGAPSKANSKEEPTQRLSRDAELADENLLIERAQTAMGRRDPDAALVALRLHRSRYPKGQLSYERDLLEREATRLKGSSTQGAGPTEDLKK